MKKLLKDRILSIIHPGHTKGCLYGKSAAEKHEFFKSLVGFATTDPQFYKEQVADLLPHEQTELFEWVKRQQFVYSIIAKLTAIIEELKKEAL